MKMTKKMIDPEIAFYVKLYLAIEGQLFDKLDEMSRNISFCRCMSDCLIGDPYIQRIERATGDGHTEERCLLCGGLIDDNNR